MRKWNLLLAGVAIILVILIMAQTRLGQAAPIGPTPTANPANDAEKTELEKALRSAAQSNQKIIPAFLVYKVAADSVLVSQDDKTAIIWMTLVDPQTNQAVATEPGLAIGHRAQASAAWQITLPTSQEWPAMVQALPDSMLSKEDKALYLPVQDNAKLATTDQIFSGYLLPWEGGKGVWLTGSVAHFTTYNSCSWVTVNGDYHSTCRYAFDFSTGGNFRVLAARGGSVVGARWTCVNDDHTCLNYLALEDRSTTPVTTQLYLHLAQNSIPAALRVNGTSVNQGDFLALADNTGMSTGSHLHFMVVANRWQATGYGGTYWWGDSVDINFGDVDINGGRPRLCSEVLYTPQYGTQCHPANQAAGITYDNWFVSGNRGTIPPTAKLSAPAIYTNVTGSSVTVSGTASGSSGVARIKVIANYDNTWKEVGPEITSNPFTTDVDLCAAGIPNGAVTLALWAWDADGNRSTLPQDPRPIQKNSSCPPPVPKCAPTADQIALFSQPDFLGNCQVFNAGKYGSSQLGAVGDNQASSILVGANMMALLYQENYEDSVMKGRSEAFLSNDAGLADNRIGVQKVSSLEVKPRVKPSAPLLGKVFNRVDTGNNPISPSSNESIILSWKSDFTSYPPDEGGTEYRAVLNYPDGTQRGSLWQTANSWSVGSLAAGSYSWTVTARNLVGETTAPAASFRVTSASPLGGNALSVPYTDSFDNGVNGWTADGIWRQANPPVGSASNNNKTLAWGFNNGNDYADAFVAAGSLTSPSLAIPSGGAFLKFRYYTATEDTGPYWDQRRVQIAVDGGAFQDLLQLKDDPLGVWQYSHAINLSLYAGKNVRIRFYFNIVDKYYNANPGWWIDDFSITTTGADTSCTEPVRDDNPANATPVGLNQTISAAICPQGDIDYYKFTANAGTAVSIDVVAKAAGSSLDPYLYLLAEDGASILAENDDIQYGVLQDSHIQYTIQRTGAYFLKVKAFNHPGVGGPTYFYNLVLNGTGQAPAVGIAYPLNNWVSPSPFVISANAAGPNGVTHVDFYWHSSDWLNGTWDLIASDAYAADGWSVIFSPAGKVIPGSVFVVRAYDAAGQESAAVIWNLQFDVTPPTTSLMAISAPTASTFIPLHWSASDSGTGLNHYELQVRDNGGAWTASGGPYPAQQTSTYFVGSGGHTYDFRLRGVDNAGNAEAFPDAPDASTQVSAACTPDAFDAAQPGDGSAVNATLLPLNSPQTHNFCAAGDEDWARITLQAGVSYQLKVISLAGGAAAAVSVTDPSGQQVLAEVKAGSGGQSSILKFIPPSSGEYRIRVRPFDSRLWGSDTTYTLFVGEARWYYMPMTVR
jgi:hypothetical protein